jgi:hypothetical protein
VPRGVKLWIDRKNAAGDGHAKAFDRKPRKLPSSLSPTTNSSTQAADTLAHQLISQD